MKDKATAGILALLHSLREKGVITDSEFQARKAKLL